MVNKLRLSGTLVYFVSLSDVEFSGGEKGIGEIAKFANSVTTHNAEAQVHNSQTGNGDSLPCVLLVG
jgi:hypothetical protein